MNTVVDAGQKQSWWDYAWREHRAWILTLGMFVLSLLVWKLHGGDTVFPQSWIDAFPFAERVNEFDKWIRPFIQPTTRAIGAGVTWFYEGVVDFLIFTQWQIVFVILVLEAFMAKRKAPDNEWGDGATTLEWTLSSPPPFHTYEDLPRIK